jgi:hypothetical protein
MKLITRKYGREGYTKLHESSQQPFVSKLLIYSTWNFLKKIVQSTRMCFGRSQVSNSGKGECFLFPPKRPDWLLGPHSLRASLYCSSSPWIKRPGCQPNNSPVSSADGLMHNTEFPLVLRLQLNEQQKVKAVWVSGTDSTVKCGLAAVWIGTALLVKVCVFWCLVWIVYSLKCWTAWTVKVEAAICRESW